MKIEKVSAESIIFDNGNKIRFDHIQDCCEYNYVDFSQLEDLALEIEFNEDLRFEIVGESGFRFGNENGDMFFLPCYSIQNGYYTSEIDIYYNEDCVLSICAETLSEY